MKTVFYAQKHYCFSAS